MEFATKWKHHSHMVPLLFEIECDLNENNDSIIFADITNLSIFDTEEEILFDASSVFQVQNVIKEEDDTKLYIVQLKVTGEGRTLPKSYVNAFRNLIRAEGPRVVLSRLLKRVGKLQKSQELLENLLRNPGEERLACIDNCLGITLKNQRKYENALQHFKIAFQIAFYSDPPDKNYSAMILYNEGRVYSLQWNNKNALRCFQRAIDIYKKETDDDEYEIALFYSGIGGAYMYQGEYELALENHFKALEIQKRLYPDHFIIGMTYTDIAKAYSFQMNYNQAIRYHLEALKVRQKNFPADHHEIAWSYYQLGKVHYKMNDFITALDYYQKSLDMAKKNSSSCYYTASRILLDIALVYRDRPDEAIIYQLEALGIQRKIEPMGYKGLAFVLDTVAITYKMLGKIYEAINCYEEALHIREGHLPKDQYRIKYNLDRLASLYEEIGDMTSATVIREKSSKIYKRNYRYDPRKV